MIVHTIAEFAQSYIAQARSSGRSRPSFSSQAGDARRSAANRDSFRSSSASAFLRDLTRVGFAAGGRNMPAVDSRDCDCRSRLSHASHRLRQAAAADWR